MVATSLVMLVASLTMMIFFQFHKSMEVIVEQQEATFELVSLQILRKHIREAEYMIENTGILSIKKSDGNEVIISKKDGQLLIEEYQDSLLRQSKVILEDITLFSIGLDSPCSVTLEVYTSDQLHKISEFCR